MSRATIEEQTSRLSPLHSFFSLLLDLSSFFSFFFFYTFSVTHIQRSTQSHTHTHTVPAHVQSSRSHKRIRNNTLLGQASRGITIQLQTEDHKCHNTSPAFLLSPSLSPSFCPAIFITAAVTTVPFFWIQFSTPVLLFISTSSLHLHTHTHALRPMNISSLNQGSFLGHQSYLRFLSPLLRCEMTRLLSCSVARRDNTAMLQRDYI